MAVRRFLASVSMLVLGVAAVACGSANPADSFSVETSPESLEVDSGSTLRVSVTVANKTADVVRIGRWWFEVEVLDMSGSRVWRSDFYVFPLPPTGSVLNKTEFEGGDTANVSAHWDLTDDDNKPVQPGVYQIIGIVMVCPDPDNPDTFTCDRQEIADPTPAEITVVQ
ncbi:MAG: hypothetical protein WD333_05940 [Dehalococcoidia bacterium]